MSDPQTVEIDLGALGNLYGHGRLLYACVALAAIAGLGIVGGFSAYAVT